MAQFQPNNWVWIQDDAEIYLPAKVLTPFAKGTPTTVMTEDGEKRKLDNAQSAWAMDCNPEALNSDIHDLINISDLNEMSILHNLRIRYREDKIYTNISSILISVNPFKLLPLYTPEVLDSYRAGYRGKAPHVFGVARNAYHSMLSDHEDQSVVISGESGAGKSEATKLILQFLTDVSSRSSNTGSANQTTSSLEQQILAANPILEAFGNAKTLRNNNSSRFGKLITVNFDTNGLIIGGGIINYLLEKSRVVGQTQGERNYHIFYQLLSAADTNPTLTEQLRLQNPELFQYTGQSGVISIDGVSDEKEFEEMQNSMDILRFSEAEKNEVFRIVAGVLHFGNAKFKIEKKSTEEDGSSIANPEVTEHASVLWGVDSALISKFLCARNIGTREVILVSYSVSQAQDARDAMVKRVYAELFQIMVNKINRELSSGGKPRHRFIGVLDIFGFESFEVNSFEQLCINFCNEKLQFHFNEHIFKMEQALYEAEGITIPGTAFVDNQPTLDLLELKGTGIFSMVDEEINVPRGSDDGFLKKVLTKYSDGKHPNCLRPKAKDCKDFLKNFGILHYAGPVFYNVNNFLEKNKDQLHPDIINVLRGSTSSMLSGMFPPEEAGGGGAAGKKQMKMTLGGQFKQQLNELIATLNTTFPHFVRCMKSNDLKVGNVFNASRMQDQLRYAGLVEVCRIRKLGYPVRRPFEEFYKRYRCCNLLSTSLDPLLKVLEEKGVLKAGEWAKGHSKVFMRTQQSLDLELAREQALWLVTIKVQKVARGLICRQRYRKFKEIIETVREAIAKRTETALKDAVDLSFELPWGGAHVELVRNAKELHLRVKEENRVLTLLENAVQVMELNGLKSAINAAANMSPPFEPAILSSAKAAVAKLEAEIACKKGLLEAIAARQLSQLVTMINRANELNLDCNELRQAIALKARIDEEDALLAKLSSATASRDLDELNQLINMCVEMGLDSRHELTEAKKVVKELLEEIARKAAEEAERERLRIIALLEEQARVAAAEAEAEKQRQAARAAAEEAERQRLAAETAHRKRDHAMLEADKNLSEAVLHCDFDRLHGALNTAMQMGLTTQSVRDAQDLLSKKVIIDDVHKQLEASLRVLSVKAESGIHDADMIPLRNAIDKGLEAAPKELALDLAEAQKSYELYQQHIRARVELTNAMASKDRKQLRQALDTAENLELRIDLMVKAKDQLREMEIAFRAGKPVVDEVAAAPGAPEPYDAAEEARKQRQELAKQARFDVKNYPALRTSDDYARGAILNKGKVKEMFLCFQATVIPKSLIDMNKDNNKLAMQIHKDLLGYMGDKQMPFPAMLAQDILRKGFEYKPIRDEIYMQIIKQLTSNPRPESVAKGWQIMCMCVGTFPPSPEFENFLLHYIIEKRDRGRGAVVDYARYCLRTLEAMLSNGDGTGFVPSVEEILAYKERPPILATIHLVDGSVITEDLPITPDLNVGKVLEMCSGWLDLKDPRVDSLGIFVYDIGESDDAATLDESYRNAAYRDLIRTPRPLRNDDFMGDIIVQRARQRRKFKFVLKKKIFLPNKNGRGSDPFYERLVYLQAEDETIIQGNIDVDDEEKVAALAGISMAVAFGEDMGSSVEDLCIEGEGNVMDFIVPAWREVHVPEEWADLILQSRDALVTSDPEDLQDQFLQIVQESAVYGTHWFYVYKVEAPPSVAVPTSIRQLPRELMLGFNAEGMHIFNISRELLVSFPYADIYRWGGSSSQFSLIMADPSLSDSFEFVIITGQAADMAAIILDHIRAIMAAQEAQED